VVGRDGLPIGLIQRDRFDDNPGWRESLRVAGTPSDAGTNHIYVLSRPEP